jgi:hypothetical protein
MSRKKHRKSHSKRRKSRSNPSWTPVVSAVVGAGAGAAAGVLSSYGLKQFNIGTPTVRAFAQIGLGVALGIGIGMKNPAIGASVGTGMATAGTVSLMDAMGLVIPPIGGATKQLRGIDPDGYYNPATPEMGRVQYDDGMGTVVNAYG